MKAETISDIESRAIYGEVREPVTDCSQLNTAKMHESDYWLNQLAAIINGDVSHYMAQSVDYFSVDCGPWHIKYDNTKGGNDERK